MLKLTLNIDQDNDARCLSSLKEARLQRGKVLAEARCQR